MPLELGDATAIEPLRLSLVPSFPALGFGFAARSCPGVLLLVSISRRHSSASSPCSPLKLRWLLIFGSIFSCTCLKVRWLELLNSVEERERKFELCKLRLVVELEFMFGSSA